MTLRSWVLFAAAALGLGGCSQSLAFNSVPAAAVDRAELKGFSNIRVWGDSKKADIDAVVGAHSPVPGASNYLALSGGGGDGAYGAGVLVGWTASGQRPSFDVVTGVSTGALAAPFAFLGSAKDTHLREVYTRYSTRDLGNVRVVSALLGGPSLLDSRGLDDLLDHYITTELMAEIAREHARGRRLLVTTTNVEAERQVIWNLGAIASSRQPEALSVLRRVLLASAALPGVFPPVLIKVTVNGSEFEEMHADGGTVGQVFFIPQSAPVQSSLARIGTATRNLYVIRNGKLGPEWQAVSATSLGIAGRSIGTLIKNQARGDVHRLHVAAQQAGIGFRLSAIPDTFSAVSTEPFDVVYMRKLFDLGFTQARAGSPWLKAPP